MRIFQKGFNFSQDGPGNRLVYHLSGCNFCCPWGSNPEGMDIKHFDSGVHKEWTDADNKTVMQNFEKLTQIKKAVLIRIPVINGFNNNPEKFVELFKKYNLENVNFEILAYHEYGKDKWKKPYTVKNGFVSNDDLMKFRNEFEKHGLRLICT